jgi:hypothetical protein
VKTLSEKKAKQNRKNEQPKSQPEQQQGPTYPATIDGVVLDMSGIWSKIAKDYAGLAGMIKSQNLTLEQYKKMDAEHIKEKDSLKTQIKELKKENLALKKQLKKKK